MSILVASILAQVVTLGLGDRTEGRLAGNSEGRIYLEGDSQATVGLRFDWRRSSLTLAYSPSITVTPVDFERRETFLVHNANIAADYRLRRTTFFISQSGSIGERDLSSESLSERPVGGLPDEPTPGPDPGAPTGPDLEGNEVRVSETLVRYGTTTSSLGFSHQLSRMFTLGSSIGYFISGGIDDVSRAEYPLVKGPSIDASLAARVSRIDTLTTSAGGQYAASDAGDRSVIATVNEAWSHSFGRHTGATVGGGVAFTRTDPSDDVVRTSIYPTAQAGVGHEIRSGRDSLSLGAGVAATPVIDRSSARVDPRIGFDFNLGWSRDDWSVDGSAGGAISIAEDRAYSLNSLGGTLSTSYELSEEIQLEGGVRIRWETFGQETVLPPTGVYYLAISFAAAVPLAGRPR